MIITVIFVLTQIFQFLKIINKRINYDKNYFKVSILKVQSISGQLNQTKTFIIPLVVSVAHLTPYAISIPTVYHLQYDPKHFNEIIIKIHDPKATYLLFASGRLVCTGTRDISANKQAIEKIRLLLKSCGVNCILHQPTEYIIRNIVGSGSTASKKHRKLVQYETELFPGAIVKFPDSIHDTYCFTVLCMPYNNIQFFLHIFKN